MTDEPVGSRGTFGDWVHWARKGASNERSVDASCPLGLMDMDENL